MIDIPKACGNVTHIAAKALLSGTPSQVLLVRENLDINIQFALSMQFEQTLLHPYRRAKEDRMEKAWAYPTAWLPSTKVSIKKAL